jgi:glycosyltransferase involved in cell wall biosynthesis
MRKTILFIHPVNSTFVERDKKILSERYELSSHFYRPEKNIFRFFREIWKIKYLLIRSRGRVSVIYCWFVDYHSVLPVLFGKLLGIKTILIIGGYDAVCLPEIRFGIFCSHFFRRSCAKLSYRYADYLCPVDASLVTSSYAYLRAEENEENEQQNKKRAIIGFKYFVNKFQAEVKVIPTGYDVSYWQRHGHETKTEQVIAVAAISDRRRFLLKGCDLLFAVAEKLPEIPFIIVGFTESYLREIKQSIPENVSCERNYSSEKVRELYAKSKVIAQFSLSEGLPNSLCEAMLCECVPVGSAVGGIPFAIGDCGYVLGKRDIEQAADLIGKALKSDVSLGERARIRISEFFPEKKRRDQLFQLIEEALSDRIRV